MKLTVVEKFAPKKRAYTVMLGELKFRVRIKFGKEANRFYMESLSGIEIWQSSDFFECLHTLKFFFIEFVLFELGKGGTNFNDQLKKAFYETITDASKSNKKQN